MPVATHKEMLMCHKETRKNLREKNKLTQSHLNGTTK